MSKKSVIIILVVALALVSGGVVLAKKLAYGWNYDGMREEERFEAIKTFAGCGGAPSYADSEDLFTEEWNKTTQRFDFTALDVDQIITLCDHDNNQVEIDSAIKRISRPKRPLTEDEIQKEITRSLENVITFDETNQNGRALTEAEQSEHVGYLKKDLKYSCLDLKENRILKRHECEENIDDIKVRFFKAEEYQKKFLNREFLVLKK